MLIKNIPNRKANEWQRDNPEKRQVIQHKYYLNNRETQQVFQQLLFTEQGKVRIAKHEYYLQNKKY